MQIVEQLIFYKNNGAVWLYGTQNTLHEIVISLYTQPPTHLVASDIQ